MASCNRLSLRELSARFFLAFGLSLSAPFILPCGNIQAAPPHQVTEAVGGTGDVRLGPPKDLNGHFPFRVPESLEAWEKRAESLRQQILVATGLWPQPEKTPLNAVIHGKVQREGFTVEKVYFESVPNHFVTGLLFRPDRPAPAEGFPAVLCPHGHGGRLEDMGEAGVRRAIAQGFERFESSGRFPALARCAQLARMGCVTFIFDMIGYGDSQQIPFEVAHRAAKQREDMEGTDEWGFYSVTAELRLQSIMGLQTWNAVRGLDFLEQLPDVNAKRMAVTGNSGGGTQTILLGAIDARPIAFFPNGMVSTSMQGGCYCENCSMLRVGTGNVELTALFAPRPAGMTAVDDWTRDMMSDGFPELQKLYALYGKQDNVMCKAYPHFPHNYNYVTRCLMYQFFNRHMGLGIPEPIVEEDYPLLSADEYTVWNDQHPRPESGAEYEKRLLKQMAEASDSQLSKLAKENPQEHAKVVRVAVETIIGRKFPEPGSVQLLAGVKQEIEGVVLHKGLLSWSDAGERVPFVLLTPKDAKQAQKINLVIKDEAKSALWQSEQLSEDVRQMLAEGQAVAAIDLFAAGENRTSEFGDAAQRWINDNRHYAAFNYGYNPTTFARRVHDVMTAWSFLKDEYSDSQIEVLASEDLATIANTAKYLENPEAASSLPFSGYNFQQINSYRHAMFVPGWLKYASKN